MSVTNFMNMELPGVLVTLGPEYAEQVNEALTLNDAHDHTSGKGKKVPTAGLDINANLNFAGFKPYNLKSVQFSNQSPTLTGASNALSAFTYTGDLWFTNGSGNAVQITSGGALLAVPGAVETLETTSITSNLLIGPSDTFVAILTDTAAPRTVTLPLASAVSAGRIYAIKDSTGTANTNAITIARQGSDVIDGETSQTISSNYGCVWVISNGATAWSII